ncbi:hypothetical protein J6590_000830 [Homalodisca vitripennis]|nr:hypothetical protein J6590_000830 [Homalodisca vitripennis]
MYLSLRSSEEYSSSHGDFRHHDSTAIPHFLIDTSQSRDQSRVSISLLQQRSRFIPGMDTITPVNPLKLTMNTLTRPLLTMSHTLSLSYLADTNESAAAKHRHLKFFMRVVSRAVLILKPPHIPLILLAYPLSIEGRMYKFQCARPHVA